MHVCFAPANSLLFHISLSTSVDFFAFGDYFSSKIIFLATNFASAAQNLR